MKVHSDERTMNSNACNKRFGQAGILFNRHKIHIREKCFKFMVCVKHFGKAGHPQEHHWVHTGEKPLKCKICDKSFDILLGAIKTLFKRATLK